MNMFCKVCTTIDKMFSSETEEQYIGKILKKLSTGKTLRHILLELSWSDRAKLLMHLKQIRKCEAAFKQIIEDKDE